MFEVTEEEINEQIGLTMVESSKFPGMSYEEGVRAALEWVIGNEDIPPMED